MSKNISCVGLLGSVLLIFSGSAGAAAADEAGPAATAVAPPVKTPSYRAYTYNYPHEIPADYVYRTERVFSPSSMAAGTSAASAATGQPPALSPAADHLAAAVHDLATGLMASARETVADEYRVAVSTFVNLNNLYATSALGRYLGEQLIGELQQAGVEVVDVRKTPGILVSKNHGEYSLSRDMKELGYVQDAQVMVVGTYAVAEGTVMVNARLLRNDDNLVLAAASLELPLTGRVARLLADEAMPPGQGSSVTVRAFDANKEGRKR